MGCFLAASRDILAHVDLNGYIRKTLTGKFSFALAAVFAVFAAWAAPEGKPLFCIAGNSPVPIEGFKPSSHDRIE